MLVSMVLSKKKRIVLAVVVTLYLITWIGGKIVFTREITADAWLGWRQVKAYDEKVARDDAAKGITHDPIGLNPDGPTIKVNWCIPLLPGILVVSSESELGGFMGQGGTDIRFYYGSGTYRIFILSHWQS